jgi:hypothetical protein
MFSARRSERWRSSNRTPSWNDSLPLHSVVRAAASGHVLMSSSATLEPQRPSATGPLDSVSQVPITVHSPARSPPHAWSSFAHSGNTGSAPDSAPLATSPAVPASLPEPSPLVTSPLVTSPLVTSPPGGAASFDGAVLPRS